MKYKRTKQQESLMNYKKHLLLSAFFVLAAGITAIQVQAQQPGLQQQDQDQGKKIKGEVVDATTGEPVEHVEISLSETEKTAMTGEEGEFSFEELEPGTYTVEVKADGYEEWSQTVEVAEDRTSELNISLQPAEEGAQSPLDRPMDRPMDRPPIESEDPAPGNQPGQQPGNQYPGETNRPPLEGEQPENQPMPPR